MTSLPKTLVGFLIKHGLRPYAKIISIWTAVLLFAGILNGISYPLSNKWFIALFEKTVPVGITLLDYAMPTIILITSLFLLQTLMNLVRDTVYSNWKPRVSNHLSQTLNDYVNAQSMNFFTSRMSGKINSQVNYISGGFFILEDILKIMIILVVILINIGLIIGINKWVAVVLGAAFLIRIVYGVFRIKKMSSASKTASKSSSTLAGKVIDSISNFSIIKLFSAAKTEKIYLESVRKIAIRDRLLASFMQRMFWAPPMFLWDLMNGAVMILCVILYSNGEMKISEIIFTISIFNMVMSMIGDIIDKIPNFVDVWGSANQSYTELIKPIDVLDADNAPDLIVSLGGIEIKNLSFKYNKKLVLDNLSLSIKPGEKIGLVGVSGAGKTTLVNLLMRMYDPSQGQILFDGVDIKSVTQDSLRRCITFIPQEPTLFNRSLMENIAYGKPDATLKMVRVAAKSAAADGFIMGTEKKYESKVGERGIKLSGGQKQRIAIARAFLKDAPILILDEATSALDSETESVIQKSFAELSQGRTTIAIAHRLSTLANMDRIIVMENGKIIESGSHEVLIKKRGGKYSKLWKMQSGGFLLED